jgi:hypothetical protein
MRQKIESHLENKYMFREFAETIHDTKTCIGNAIFLYMIVITQF